MKVTYLFYNLYGTSTKWLSVFFSLLSLDFRALKLYMDSIRMESFRKGKRLNNRLVRMWAKIGENLIRWTQEFRVPPVEQGMDRPDIIIKEDML